VVAGFSARHQDKLAMQALECILLLIHFFHLVLLEKSLLLNHKQKLKGGDKSIIQFFQTNNCFSLRHEL
jgi:hypothetical protein